MPIVECMGLPAAGKSTLAERLYRMGLVELEKAYWEVAAQKGARGVLEKIVSLLPANYKTPLSGPMSRLDVVHRFLSREAAYAEVVFKEAAGIGDEAHRQSFLHAWLKYIALTELIGQHGNPTQMILAEEGFAHRAMTLFGYHKQMAYQDRLMAYLDPMPKPKAVIWVRETPSVCVERLKQRDQKQVSLRERPESSWEAQLEIAEKVLSGAAACLAARGTPVIEVAGNAVRDPARLKEILSALHRE